MASTRTPFKRNYIYCENISLELGMAQNLAFNLSAKKAATSPTLGCNSYCVGDYVDEFFTLLLLFQVSEKRKYAMHQKIFQILICKVRLKLTICWLLFPSFAADRSVSCKDVAKMLNLLSHLQSGSKIWNPNDKFYQHHTSIKAKY